MILEFITEVVTPCCNSIGMIVGSVGVEEICKYFIVISSFARLTTAVDVVLLFDFHGLIEDLCVRQLTFIEVHPTHTRELFAETKR